MESDRSSPVAVGGIGGSGTRVIATLLQMLGYHLGDDLNHALDNLWFTLLFKRRSILLEDEAGFRSLASLFFARMSGELAISEADRLRVLQLADRERPQHPSDWLQARALTFLDPQTARRPGRPWGWKEPNTHVVLDRLCRTRAGLKYIHVVRHPIVMASHANQNQLHSWGAIFLDRDPIIGPRDSLAYWCAAHRRVLMSQQKWPERVLVVEFEAVCADPDRYCRAIAAFLGAAVSDDLLARFRGFVVPPPQPALEPDLTQFDPADLDYLVSLGVKLVPAE